MSMPNLSNTQKTKSIILLKAWIIGLCCGSGTNSAIKSLYETSTILTSKIHSYLEGGEISRKNLKKLNKQLIALEKSFISDKGMYFGAWYKSIYASSDPFSGYGAWILPGLEYEIALKSSERLKEWDSRYSNAINSLESKMKNLIQEIN